MINSRVLFWWRENPEYSEEKALGIRENQQSQPARGQTRDKWALCMKLSHGIKSAPLDGKIRTGKSKTKKSHAWLVEIGLFWRLLHSFAIQYGGFCTMWHYNARAHCSDHPANLLHCAKIRIKISFITLFNQFSLYLSRSSTKVQLQVSLEVLLTPETKGDLLKYNRLLPGFQDI